MTDVLSALTTTAFVDFVRLFRPDEGRAESPSRSSPSWNWLREGLIEIVQSESYAPLQRASRQILLGT